MAKKKKTLEDLVEEALGNVREDRQRILEAYNETKQILTAHNVDDMEAAGNTVTKLLEGLIKSNEQAIKLAQIKEREESRQKVDPDKRNPLDIEEITNFFESKQERDNN